MNNTNINNTNIQPQNTLLDIKNKNEVNSEIKVIPPPIDNNDNNNINTEENKDINKNNISQNKNVNNDEEKKNENNKNNDNNIISKNDFKSNNLENYQESQIFNSNVKETIIDIQRNKQNEKESNNEQEINISELNNILESKVEINQEQNNGDINNLKTNQNQMGNNNLPNNKKENELKVVQESYPLDQDGENNKFSKTDPNAFKKEDPKERDFDINKKINFQPLQTFTKNKFNNKLFNFAKDFANRDQPILNKKDPKLNDLNGFTKEIVEEEKYKKELEDSENMENYIENNAKEKKIENYKDLDKKSEGELLDIIKNTLNKINQINEKGQVAGFYFETMNKAIDFKMIENEEKMMREAYNKKGELKNTRTNPSKAKIAIEEAHKDIGENDDSI